MSKGALIDLTPIVSEANFKILSLNIDSKIDEQTKISHIKRLIEQGGADFVLLQELNITKLIQASNALLPQFRSFILLKSRELIETEYIEREANKMRKESPSLPEEQILSRINKSLAKVSGGLGTYFHKKWMDKVRLLCTDSKYFRFIATIIRETEEDIFLVLNVYGLSEGVQKSNEFFRYLSLTIDEMKRDIRLKYKTVRRIKTIIGGDLDSLDDEDLDMLKLLEKGRSHQGESDLKLCHVLVDIFRYNNGNIKKFTCRRKIMKTEKKEEFIHCRKPGLTSFS